MMRTRQGVAFVRKFHYFGLSRHTHTPLGYLCARYSYICTHAIYSQGLKVKSFCLSAKINFHLTCNGPQKTCFPSGLGQVMWPRPPIFFPHHLGWSFSADDGISSLKKKKLHWYIWKFKRSQWSRLNAKISPIHWLGLIELAINGRPNIIKYQFKLTQQQFKPAKKFQLTDSINNG